MRRALSIGLLALATAAALRPAFAEDACAAFKWPVDKERAALSARDLPVLATGGAYPALGTGIVLTLGPQAGVAYSVPPTRLPKANPAYGAEITAETKGGTVQVTVSEDVWIDLIQRGAILRSIAFSGKTGCAGVRKSIRFSVAPGPLAISVSNSPAASIKLDVTAVE